MKKKLFIAFCGLLLLTGCGNSMDTPTMAVEDLLGRYQSLDSDVLDQLDNVISSDNTMDDTQKADYKSLMEKQYQNLSYKIKGENINNDTATVDVEIEVFDYATSINKSLKYYTEHQDEFINQSNKDTDGAETTDQSEDDDSNDTSGLIEESYNYINYKIQEMKNVSDKIKYDMTFTLTKKDGKWEVENISDMDREKIHGLFAN